MIERLKAAAKGRNETRSCHVLISNICVGQICVNDWYFILSYGSQVTATTKVSFTEQYNKLDIFLGLIKYELNCPLAAWHIISSHSIRPGTIFARDTKVSRFCKMLFDTYLNMA